MTTDKIKALTKSRVAVFRNFELANLHAENCVKPHWIVLGDHDGECGEYWVATPADAQRLERAGYEMV